MAAARHGQFQAAASELGVTPGAVSRQMRALEDQLGVALFYRTPRRITLTEAGERLFASVEPSLLALDRACRNEQENAGTQRELVIEAMPTLALHWLIPRLPQFQKRHPGLTVVLHTSQAAIDPRRAVHLFLRRDPDQFSGLEGHAFMLEYAVLVASPALLAGGVPLSALPRIAMRSRPDLWPLWQARMGDRGVNPSQVRHPQPAAKRTDINTDAPMQTEMSFDTTALAIQAAVQGLGVALIPRLFLGEALATRALVTIPGIAPLESGAYYWLSPPPKLTRAATYFVAWLREAAHDA